MIFDSKLALKELRFLLIINLVMLPVVILLNQNLLLSYSWIVGFEGFCSLALGGFELFLSLFSTIEREDHRYVGHRMMRYQLKVEELEPHHKMEMRRIGFTLVIMGLVLLSLPALLLSIGILL